MKNLKTKDYLGKARLVAASDRNNAFTGFQGSELKKAMALEATAKDDRPAENISFAATNLVQKNLPSRSRQQSEPPLGRNTFPPTPPPESDRTTTSTSNSGAGLTQRAASVRSGGRPPRLDLAGTNGRTGDMPSMGKTRIGTTRTASEPRGPHSRQYSPSSRARDGRPRLAGSRRSEFDFVPEEGYAGEVFDMYTTSRLSGLGLKTRQQQQQQQQQQYIEEETEYASEYTEVPVEEFDMMAETGTTNSARASGLRPRTGSTVRTQSRRPEVRRFRVKVHALEDTRYIMVEASIAFGEFEGRIREKFGFRGLLRIRMRDDNDMITMGDQEDLDLLMMAARDEARRENQDMGKIEVCFFMSCFGESNY